jgi:hypothetical protein
MDVRRLSILAHLRLTYFTNVKSTALSRDSELVCYRMQCAECCLQRLAHINVYTMFCTQWLVLSCAVLCCLVFQVAD